MVNALEARPENPQIGDVWMQPITEILNTFHSCDGAEPGEWEELLEGKREDGHYQDVIESLRENGFVRPLTYYQEAGWTWNEQAGKYEDDGSYRHMFGDGHHRLAAAIDLGWEYVPVKYREHSTISKDSGYWRMGKPILTEEEVESNAPYDYDDEDDWV